MDGRLPDKINCKAGSFMTNIRVSIAAILSATDSIEEGLGNVSKLWDTAEDAIRKAESAWSCNAAEQVLGVIRSAIQKVTVASEQQMSETCKKLLSCAQNYKLAENANTQNQLSVRKKFEINGK